jgi:uncharacterized protein (TIGR02996 family)
MTDSKSFLQAILADPEDDTPRLVYADWLEERGDLRGEFIRVQCHLAQKQKYDPSRLPLEARQQELLAGHGSEWAGPVAGLVRDYEFHRGFVDTVAIGLSKFLSHGDKLLEMAPVRNVKLLRVGSSNVKIPDVAACPLLRQLRGLELQGSLSDADFRTLVTSPHLKQLAALILGGCHVNGAGLEPVLAGCLPHLQALDLGVDSQGGSCAFGAAEAEILAKARWASSLKALNLKYHRIGVIGAEALAGSR